MQFLYCCITASLVVCCAIATTSADGFCWKDVVNKARTGSVRSYVVCRPCLSLHERSQAVSTLQLSVAATAMADKLPRCVIAITLDRKPVLKKKHAVVFALRVCECVPSLGGEHIRTLSTIAGPLRQAANLLARPRNGERCLVLLQHSLMHAFSRSDVQSATNRLRCSS